MGGFDDLAAQFDQASQKHKGDQFEAVCKWFLENDPTYKPLLRRVWLWKDWPGRRGIDAGIDLVAEAQDGTLWAIQAKAYDPAYSISKRDVDKFVSESSRAAFTHRLLIGTTDRRHHLATRLMDDLGIPFLGLTRLREADDHLDWPSSPAALRPPKPVKPKKPWDYQKAAVADVVEGFKTAERGQLIMACGTGKTLTAWFITEKLAAQRTLVLVPSLSLLKQTMREWQTANPKAPFATLPVCSDETVGSLGEDAAVSHTSDLGVPVTTDPTVIAEFLRKRGPRVVFSTYQSSPQIAAAFKLGRVPAFDLVIADEAHRVAGPVSSDFATVLDPEAIKAQRRLFMTATPRYFTGRILRAAKEADYEVASMDDHSTFGEVFHRLTFGQAIDRGLLTDYQVAIIGVDDATYRDWAERGTLVTLDGKRQTDARSLAGQIGLAKAMKKFDLHRVISFHSRVKAAKEFAASMPAVLDWMPPRQRPRGTLWSEYASGEMSAGDRHVLLQHLKRLDDGERGLLANARCLSEGVDVPALDGVAFIDPRRSEVDIVQAVGRAIRKSDTKTVGTIVIPVFIDTDEDAEVALDSSVFKPVWDVIKALRAHDTELGEQLDELRRNMGRRGGTPRLPGRVFVDLPPGVAADFASAFEARLVDATTAPWEFWYGLLERYVAEHGTARVRSTYIDADGRKLGSWVVGQRMMRNKGLLEVSREGKLAQLEGWTWDSRTEMWEEPFALLMEFIEENGHARVPGAYKVDGYPLGTWVGQQRVDRTKGILRQDRMRRLDGLPGWSWDPVADRWEDGFQRLLGYISRNGNALVPQSYVDEDGFKLGIWVFTQRRDATRGLVDAVRARRLSELAGWSWDPLSDLWETGFRQLVKYVDAKGHANVPHAYQQEDGYKLGHWVAAQRQLHAKGKIQAQREKRLADLPGWLWELPTATDQWEVSFRRLKLYVESNGSALVPSTYKEPDGYKLGQWVVAQRHKRAKGKLIGDQELRLANLNGWTWDTDAAQWEEGFNRLLNYVDNTGHARVPSLYKDTDGYKLGGWVVTQRHRRNKGRMEPDRERRLDEISDWSWDTDADQWEQGFRRLEAYEIENGDALVPFAFSLDGFQLGYWVRTQRDKYTRGVLGVDRQQRLEALNGWSWNPIADKWEEGFERLIKYIDQSGHAHVPQSYVDADGYKLGWWVGTQRRKRRDGKLDANRMQRLEQLTGWTWEVGRSKPLRP